MAGALVAWAQVGAEYETELSTKDTKNAKSKTGTPIRRGEQDAKEPREGRVWFGKKKKRDLVEAVYDFEPVTPEAAVDWFRDLVALTEEELDGLARDARAKSVTISGAVTREQVEAVQGKILEFIEQGRTLAEFQGEFAALWEALGLDPKKPSEVENLFRSEVMRAYGAGRTVALRDPDVKDAFPMWQYMAVMDDRVRPEHAALNGVVLPADDPFWNSHTPPWDYQCRCDVVPVSKREIEENGIEPTSEVTLEDGTVVSVSQIPGAGSGFRGIGFGANAEAK